MSNPVLIVICAHGPTPYGPFNTREQAEEFAAFLAAEVDPAYVTVLRSPVTELLGWREMKLRGES